MPAIIVNVAVIHEDQILLTKRDDFEVWCLPGGGIEEGESVARAAIRETKEETGLDVELKSLVGLYSCTGAIPDTHVVLFSAAPIGGTIQTQPGETIDVRFFPSDEIPEDLAIGYHKRIEDAFRGIGGSVAVLQEMTLPADKKISHHDLIETYQLSRHDRQKFYRQTLQRVRIRVETEVGKGS